MRIAIPILSVACALAAPLFCQSDKDYEPISYEERELKACGPKAKDVKYVVEADKKAHPAGKASADQSLIYVVRPPGWGARAQSSLAVDGEWKGVNRANGYLFLTVKPGLHFFCSETSNRSIVVLTAEPGKTYYLEQTVHPGAGMKARTQLVVVDDSDGRMAVAKADPSTWHVAPAQGEKTK